MKLDDEEELVRVFREQFKLEKEIEDAKIILIRNHPDFNLMDAFQLFDSKAKGYITADEIFITLQDMRCRGLSIEDVYLFVSRFDSDADGRLLYSDFC